MDKTILSKLKKNPEEGMALLMEQYMGLLWSACRLYLENPEDVRECVQDTFLDFYEHLDRFRPEKGTLKAYLYVVAKRKALHKMQDNMERSSERLDDIVLGNEDDAELLTDRAALEAALQKLKEEDSRIIRMKYYEGMTCAEIAKSMNLPLETVKKRQQRSLKKLRLILLGLAVLGLLTACAAAVYRFRFHPMSGFQSENTAVPEDNIWYVMKEDTVDVETKYGICTVDRLIWAEGKILLSLEVPNTEDMNAVEFDGVRAENRTSISSKSSRSDDPSVPIEMELQFMAVDPYMQIHLNLFGTECTVNMEPIQEYSDFSQIGEVDIHNNRVIAVQSERNGDFLFMDAYVYSPDCWKITYLIPEGSADALTQRSGFQREELVNSFVFHREETTEEKPFRLMLEGVTLVSVGEEPVCPITIPNNSQDLDVTFQIGEDIYQIYRLELSRDSAEVGVGSSDEDMITEYRDELLIYVRPVKIETDTEVIRYEAELGRLNNPESEQSYRHVDTNWFQMDADCIRIMLPEDWETDERQDYRLKILHVYKNWNQVFQFKIP